MNPADFIMLALGVFISVLCIAFIVAVAKDSGAAKWRQKYEEERHLRYAAENKVLALQKQVNEADDLVILQQRQNAFMQVRLGIRDANFSTDALRKAMAFPIPKNLKVIP